jgi:hypothetical protein
MHHHFQSSEFIQSPCPPGQPKFYPRAILKQQQAIEIYQFRSGTPHPLRHYHFLTGKASAIARAYNVSPKAIRDIWNHRTWRAETRHMWTSDDAQRKSGEAREAAPNAESSAASTDFSEAYISDWSALDWSSLGAIDDTPGEGGSGSVCALFDNGGALSVDWIGWDRFRGITPEDSRRIGCDRVHDPTMDDPFHFDWPHW